MGDVTSAATKQKLSPDWNIVITGLKYSARYNEYCDGRWWRTGPCGWWSKICVGCRNICACNSRFSFRPCINPRNSNWGGSWGHTCGASSQRLYFKIGEEKKTTTSTSTITTITTTLVPLVVNTWVMPEKSRGKITTLMGKTVCKGGSFAVRKNTTAQTIHLTAVRIVCELRDSWCWVQGSDGGAHLTQEVVEFLNYCKYALRKLKNLQAPSSSEHFIMAEHTLRIVQNANACRVL